MNRARWRIPVSYPLDTHARFARDHQLVKKDSLAEFVGRAWRYICALH